MVAQIEMSYGDDLQRDCMETLQGNVVIVASCLQHLKSDSAYVVPISVPFHLTS